MNNVNKRWRSSRSSFHRYLVKSDGSTKSGFAASIYVMTHGQSNNKQERPNSILN